MNRFFGTTFALASLAMSAMVILYITVLAPGMPEGEWSTRTEYMLNHWGLYATHWRIEFLAVALTAFASLYFAHRNSMWLLVAVGHLFYLGQYPLMLAGYQEAGDVSDFSMLNEMAIFIFAAANLLWLTGMIGVYIRERGWLRMTGVLLSSVGAAAFFAMFMGFIGMELAAIGGLPALVLYWLNAYYGFTILSRKDSDFQAAERA